MGNNNLLLPALFGCVIGGLSFWLKILWDELKTIRERMHKHNKETLRNDAKIMILTTHIERLDEHAHRRIIERFEEIEKQFKLDDG